MAQTTSAISGAANVVEYSVNGSSWTDISGFSQSVEVDAQARANGAAYTFDGDAAIVTFGKLEPFTITVNVVYTEDASSVYEALLSVFQAAGGGAFYLRWTPAGQTAGNNVFTTPSTKISEFPVGVNVDASSGDPLMFEFVVGPVPSITMSAYST